MKQSFLTCALLFILNWCTAQPSLSTTQLIGQNYPCIPQHLAFLNINPDAGAGGTGDAGHEQTGYDFFNYYNCASSVFARDQAGGTVSYTPWLRSLLNGIDLYALGLHFKPSASTGLAFSFRQMRMPDLTFANIVGNTAGIFHPKEYAADLSFSRLLSKYFSAGMCLRYIYSDLTNGVSLGNSETHAARCLALDLGATHRKVKDLTLHLGNITWSSDMVNSWGVSISNLGERANYWSNVHLLLPASLRISGGSTVMLNLKNDLSLSGELNKLLLPTTRGCYSTQDVLSAAVNSFADAPGGIKEELSEITLSGGLQWVRNKFLSFRTGYFYEDQDKGGRNYFTVGAGLNVRHCSFNASYLLPAGQRSPLQNTFRFSLGYRIPDLKPHTRSDHGSGVHLREVKPEGK